MTIRTIFRTAFHLLLIPALLTSVGYAASRQAASTSASESSLHAAAPGSQQSSESHYVIGDDDMLGINVWNEPDFKQTLPVRSDGKITLPLIGSVLAAGRTPSQLEKAIATKLQAYIHHPNVTVMVLKMNSRKFNILGRVTKPGSYPLTGKTTVLDAIADAGGFTPFAKKAHIYVLRKTPSGKATRIRFNYKQVIKGKHLNQNVVLQPQDTVIVP